MSKLSLLEINQSQLDSTPVIDGQLIVCLDTGNAYRDTATAHVKIGSDLEVVTELPLAPLSGKFYYLKPDKLYVYDGGNWMLLNGVGDLNELIAKLPVGSADASDNMYYIAQDSVSDTYTRRPASKLWNYIKSKAQEIFATKNHTHTQADIGLGNVDNIADKDKSVKYATNSGSALAVENLNFAVDVASSGQSADVTLSSLDKAKSKFSVGVTGVATVAKKDSAGITIDVPNQNDILNALTNDDIDAITGGMIDDDGNPIKPNEVIVDASLTVSGRAADAKVTGDKIKEVKATADSASSGVKSVREELDQLKSNSVAIDKTLTKEGFAADAKTVGEKFNIKADVVAPHTFTIPITG